MTIRVTKVLPVETTGGRGESPATRQIPARPCLLKEEKMIDTKKLAKEIFDTEDRLRKDTLGGYLTEKGIESVISSFLREEENDE